MEKKITSKAKTTGWKGYIRVKKWESSDGISDLFCLSNILLFDLLMKNERLLTDFWIFDIDLLYCWRA